MKHIFRQLSILFLVGFFSISSYSQTESANQKPGEIDLSLFKNRISKISISVGTFSDSYPRVSSEGFKSMVKGDFEEPINLNGFTGDYVAQMVGGSIAVNLHIAPALHPNRELKLGVAANVARESVVTYFADGQKGYDGDNFTYCLVENEVVLQAAYLYKIEGRRFSAFAGPTASLGGTFNNKMYTWMDGDSVDRPEQEDDAKASNYSRLGVQFGAMFRPTKRLDVGLVGNYGLGAQFVHGGPTSLILNSYSVSLELGYRLRK